VRSSFGIDVWRTQLLLYYDVGCAFDTCSLHVPSDVRLKWADFEVGENGWPKRIGPSKRRNAGVRFRECGTSSFGRPPTHLKGRRASIEMQESSLIVCVVQNRDRGYLLNAGYTFPISQSQEMCICDSILSASESSSF
jgi:hypothetical protein